MTLKQGQHRQTWYELLDQKQGYNHAKFERPPLQSHSVLQNPNVKVLVKSENTSIIYLEYVQKLKIVICIHHLL